MPDDEDESASEWLDKAEEDLAVAEDLEELGHWDAAAFHAQQAAEKALKAVQIRRQGAFDKIHDLWKLATLLKAEPAIADHCAELSAWYTAARYPDAAGGATEEDARDACARAREVLAWSRTQLR